jgi:hypothetical protein
MQWVNMIGCGKGARNTSRNSKNGFLGVRDLMDPLSWEHRMLWNGAGSVRDGMQGVSDGL